MPRIHIIGDIDESAFASFDIALSEAEASKAKNVDVILSSAGGSAIDAIAFHDRIKASRCEIHIIVYGEASSAAVLVLAAGDTRRMSKNSWVLLHEDTTDVTKSMRVQQAQRCLDHSAELETQWNKLLASSTTTDHIEWAKMHQDEEYLTAEDCLALGLIDKVL